MDDLFSRFWQDLISRPGGAYGFRFFLQPTMAVILAIRSGIHDARASRPPYLWSVVTDRSSRRSLLRSGWQDIAKVFTLAVFLDILFQLSTFQTLYPMEALTIAFVLAVIPYALVRGPTNRILKRRFSRPEDQKLNAETQS